MLAAVFAGLTIAQALGLPLGAWLVDVAGYRATFALIAAASVAVATLVWRYVPRDVAATPTSLRMLGSVLVEPRLMTALSFIVFFIGGSFVFLTYLTSFLQDRYGLEGSALAGVLLVYGAGAVVGNAMGGRMVDRLGPATTLLILCAVQVLVLPVLSLWETPVAIAVSLLRVEEADDAAPADLPPHRPHRAGLPQWVPQVRLAAPAQERVIRGTASG